jgi:glycoprotein 6-alpha-L-fucosyltransferase
LAIPEDLANKLMRFHSNPAAWWNGQFVRYATRPNEVMQKHLDDKMKELGFDHPIVG